MRIRVLAISAVLALLPLGHVSAEPQILGLVATNSAKQLNWLAVNALQNSLPSAWNRIGRRLAI
jgi:hypothetical protein